MRARRFNQGIREVRTLTYPQIYPRLHFLLGGAVTRARHCTINPNFKKRTSCRSHFDALRAQLPIHFRKHGGQRAALIQSRLEAVKRAGIWHLVADHEAAE